MSDQNASRRIRSWARRDSTSMISDELGRMNRRTPRIVAVPIDEAKRRLLERLASDRKLASA